MSSTSPNSHNILVAEYTLGLLDLHDMAKAHQLLSSDDRAVEMALDWENSLLELTDLLPPVDPSPLLLQRIQATLGHDTMPSPSSLYRQPSSMRSRDETAPASSASSAPPPSAASTAPAREHTTGPAQASPVLPAAVTPLPQPRPAAPPASPAAPSASTPANTPTAQVTPISSRQPKAAANGGDTQGEQASGPSILASISPRAPAAPPAQATPLRRAEHTLGDPELSQAQSRQRETSGAQQATQTSQASHGPAAGQTAASQPAAETAPARNTRTSAADGPPPAKQLWLWRAATVVFAGIALALAVIPGKPVEPPITIVKVAPTRAAILQAPGQSSTPAWIVTFDPQGNVLMAPEVRSDNPADASVQLWTYTEPLRQPRSLGLVDPNKPITIPASLMGEIGSEQYFEMTLEPQGGSANGSPSGPVLFIGQVVVFGAASQTDPNSSLGSAQPANS
jgi:anti-sigma-K factor RskA